MLLAASTFDYGDKDSDSTNQDETPFEHLPSKLELEIEYLWECLDEEDLVNYEANVKNNRVENQSTGLTDIHHDYFKGAVDSLESVY